MRFPVALFAGLTLISVAASAAAEAPAPVRLIAPAREAELPAGGRIELEWEFTAEPLAGADEWEAFLSLDDGTTYPIRLTPHLDLDRRRVSVRIPEMPAPAVRFLLRIGNERKETSFEVGGSFSIVPSGALATPPRPRLVAPAAGEAAKPGLAGVTRWVEGGRDGSGWREVQARPDPIWQSSFTPGRLGLGATLPPRRPSPAILVNVRLETGESLAFSPASPDPATPDAHRPLLLLQKRANR